MYKKIFIHLFLVFVLGINIYAQKTEMIKDPLRVLNEANESFNEKKYSLAFQQYINFIESNIKFQDNNLEVAYYKKAVSAYYLANNDADILLNEFVNKYPNSSFKNNAYFYLANFYQSKNEFKKALDIFEAFDEKNLTRDEKYEYYYKIGYSYFNLLDYEKAKQYFIKVKDNKNKYSSPSTYYFAHILYEEANYDYALREFKSLSNDRNFKGIVPYYIVQIYYIQGNYAELIKNAKQLSESSTSKRSAQTNKMLGEAYCRLDRYEEAIPYLEKGVRDSKNPSPEDNYLLGYSLAKSNRHSEAIPFLNNSIIRKDSLAQNAYYHLGYAYLGTGDKQASRTAFKEAYELDYDKDIKEDALLNYAKLSYELPNPFNETLKSFQTYYENYPRSKKINEVREYLAQLYGTSKNYQDAIRLIEEMPKRSKTINQAYQRVLVNRGIELLNEGRNAEASNSFKKSLENNHDEKLTLAAYYLNSEALYRLKDYNSSINNLIKFFANKNSSSSIYYPKANYTLAYNFFQKKDYQKALLYFNKFLSASKNEDDKVIVDVFNRLGDTYFMSKDFDNAVAYYDKAINKNLIDVDYSLYQKAISVGAMGRIETKTNLLQRALNDYPNSTYRASILFELANSYLVLDQSQKALKTYQMVVNEYPNSNHTKSSISKIGLIYYKQGKDDLALNTLDKLVKTYPTSEESKDGLKSIRQIHVDQNRVEDYYKYVKTIPNVNYSAGEKDSITYEAVENLYMSGNCEKSVQGFKSYLNEFPNGFFATNANFYLADCLNKQGDFQGAYNSYLFVCNSPKNKFSEVSLLNASELAFKTKDYSKAVELYTRLEKEAEISNHKTTAHLGNMRSHFFLNNFDTAIVYARKVLENNKNTNITIDEARYIIAKSAISLNNTKLGLEEFDKLKKSKNGEFSGEANYVFAYNSYTNKKYSEAEKMILSYSSNPSSEYWLAKLIILLGDIYVENNKTLMAKQTYQSIVDNYEGEELVKIAQEKIDAILAKENEKLKILEDSSLDTKQDVDEVIISTGK